LPTPINLSIKKDIIAEEKIKPLLLSSKIIDKLNIKERKRMKNNRGRTPGVKGSIKDIIKRVDAQRRRVIMRVGKKFFLRLTISFLFLLFIC